MDALHAAKKFCGKTDPLDQSCWEQMLSPWSSSLKGSANAAMPQFQGWGRGVMKQLMLTAEFIFEGWRLSIDVELQWDVEESWRHSVKQQFCFSATSCTQCVALKSASGESWLALGPLVQLCCRNITCFRPSLLLLCQVLPGTARHRHGLKPGISKWSKLKTELLNFDCTNHEEWRS